jgi:hypothetical protein
MLLDKNILLRPQKKKKSTLDHSCDHGNRLLFLAVVFYGIQNNSP